MYRFSTAKRHHIISIALYVQKGGATGANKVSIKHRTGHSLSAGPMVHGVGVNIDNLETHDTREVLPGVGFTVEYDIQLYFRRAKQLQLSWWDDRYLEELIAADRLDHAPV